MSPFVSNKPGPSTASSVSFALLLFLSSKALHSSSCGCAGWLRFIDRAGHLWVGSARPPHHSQLWKKVFFFKSCTVDWFCIVQRSLILFGDKFREFSRFQNLWSCLSLLLATPAVWRSLWSIPQCGPYIYICLFDVLYLQEHCSCREKLFPAKKKFNIQ